MKRNSLIAIVLTVAALVSCDRERNDEPMFTAAEARINAEMDVVSDDITSIAEDQYQMHSTATGRASGTWQTILPNCASVNTTFTDASWTSVITFNEGCTLDNGNSVEGQITVTGSNDFDSQTYVLDYNLSGFYHNGRLVEGNRHVTFTTQSTSAQPEPHTVAEIEIGYTINYPDGTIYTRQGNRVRELISGYQTPYWLDNVYLVSGSWTTTFPSGVQFSEVENPLRIEMTCPHIVSGSLSITRAENNAVIDYGNGQCDAAATLSINGASPVNITL